MKKLTTGDLSLSGLITSLHRTLRVAEPPDWARLSPVMVVGFAKPIAEGSRIQAIEAHAE